MVDHPGDYCADAQRDGDLYRHLYDADFAVVLLGCADRNYSADVQHPDVRTLSRNDLQPGDSGAAHLDSAFRFCRRLSRRALPGTR
ncbi:hypothetical protein D3C73_1493810 [compost metagenome]